MKRPFSGLIIFLFVLNIFGNTQYEEILKLKEKIIDLQNKGKLNFKDLTLCSKIISFGAYVPLQEPKIKRGGSLLVYYEPVNVFTNRKKGTYEIWYTQDLILLDSKKKVIFKKEDALNFHYTFTSPVMDLYATNSLELGNLPKGKYIYKIVLKDKLKDAIAVKEISFEIIE
ncbi:hypothetical protein NLC29_00235 [Candidatus Aminicenantes bacterium AH-873-B07]|jgi:hypothetical protein|nr:hypothetical protein [Candidatus Aminicenantes bacterium AH-873-B07]